MVLKRLKYHNYVKTLYKLYKSEILYRLRKGLLYPVEPREHFNQKAILWIAWQGFLEAYTIIQAFLLNLLNRIDKKFLPRFISK